MFSTTTSTSAPSLELWAWGVFFSVAPEVCWGHRSCRGVVDWCSGAIENTCAERGSFNFQLFPTVQLAFKRLSCFFFFFSFAGKQPFHLLYVGF